MKSRAYQFRDVDFKVINEDYSRFRLDDRTVIKAKVVVKKILFSILKSPEGYPSNFGMESINAITALVPVKLKRNPSQTPFNPNVDKGREIGFEEQEIITQKYMTDTGFRITVKPVVTKVFKYNKYNLTGEPIYNVKMQPITNIEKIKNK